jgi:hypothetical protein
MEDLKTTFKGLSLSQLCDIYGVPCGEQVTEKQSAAVLLYRVANDIRENVLRYNSVPELMVLACGLCVESLLKVDEDGRE